MSEKQVYAYRAICPHGKVRAMVVDEPIVMKDSAKDIASWLKDGLTLDRVTIEEARKSDMACAPCDEFWKAKRRRKKTAAEQQALLAEAR